MTYQRSADQEPLSDDLLYFISTKILSCERKFIFCLLVLIKCYLLKRQCVQTQRFQLELCSGTNELTLERNEVLLTHDSHPAVASRVFPTLLFSFTSQPL